MEIRSSDPVIALPSLAGRSRETIRVLGTGAQPFVSQQTAMQDLIGVAKALAAETALRPAVERLQRETARILGLRDALCFWIDWPHRIAWTLAGRVSHDLEDTVIDVAGSGKRNVLAGAVVEPLGVAPARAVLALRKPSGVAFTPSELIILGTLANSIAPAMDRLIRASTRP